MVNDTIGDLLTRIRNAGLRRSETVSLPLTRIGQQICQILEKEGFIESFQTESTQELRVRLKYRSGSLKGEERPCITNLRRISRPGLRIYANHKEIPKILGGMGIIILSTSQGLLTDREARLHGIGGEILCSIW
jgi:small subunit ribosomal protein S8